MNEIKKGETKDVKNPFYKELWFIITVIVLSVIILLSSTLGLYFGLRKDVKDVKYIEISGFNINNIGKYYDDDNVHRGFYEEYNFDEQIMPWSHYWPNDKRIVQWDGQIEVEVFLSDIDPIFNGKYSLVGSILLKDFTIKELDVTPTTRYYTEFSVSEGFIELAEYSESYLSKEGYSYFLFDKFEIIDHANYYNSSTGEITEIWNSHIILNDYLHEQEIAQQGPINNWRYKETASYYYYENIEEYIDGSSPNSNVVEEYENGGYYSYAPIQGFQFEESYKPEEFKFGNSLYIS